LQLYYITFIF